MKKRIRGRIKRKRGPVVSKKVTHDGIKFASGLEKYGSTLDDERRLKMKGLTKYLNDIQEELMDAVLYIQAAREELRDLSEEALIDRHREGNYTAPLAYNMDQSGYDDEEEI